MTTIKRFTPDYAMHAARFEPFAREAEHGEYVRFDAHQQKVSALEAERDAMAVENAALKKSLIAISLAEPIDGETIVCDFDTLVSIAAGALTTPATDSALAAIQAQGVEKFAQRMHEKMEGLDPIKLPAYAEEIDHLISQLYAFAAELREAK